jgi:hypothetical protein
MIIAMYVARIVPDDFSKVPSKLQSYMGPLLISSFVPLSPFGKVLHPESHSNVSNQHSCTDLLIFQCFTNSIITSSKLLSFPSEAMSCPLIFLSSVCVSSVIEIVVIAATIDIECINIIYVLLTHGEHTHHRENTRKSWTIPLSSTD